MAFADTKLEAVTAARRALGDALVEQTMGLRNDINEVGEQILSGLYDSGARSVSPVQGVLETIIDDIMKHDAEHPDHGIGCACHDRHAGRIRRLMDEKGLLKPGHQKSLSNLFRVFSYLNR